MEIKKSKKEDTITITRTTFWKFGTFLFAVLFVISLMTGGFGTGDEDVVVPQAAAPQPAAPQAPPTNVKLKLGNEGVIEGDENAGIELIEFSDFECPFCGRFYTQTLSQIKKDYIDTGKVKMIYKDFPLSFHPSAMKAAIAGECAKEQGKFWELHDKIFDNQQAWANQGPIVSIPLFKQYASDLGLDENQFNTCLDEDKYADEVQEDIGEAGSLVSGTPTFLIGNEKDGYTVLVGAQPYQAFKQILDERL